jgi:hypothetical protein
VQDLRVATEATQIVLEARVEIASDKIVKLQQNSVTGEIPSLDDIVDALDIGKSEVDEQSLIGTELDLHDAIQFLANSDSKFLSTSD